jgi:hypothetical protein
MSFARWRLAAVALVAAPGLAQAQEGTGCNAFKWSIEGAAGLPKAPERAPKFPSDFAGHFVLAAPAKPGVYRLTMSSGAWVDVLDGGSYLHPIGFSGAKDCEGARKSVKFDLPSRPLALQLSGVPRDQISVIVSPDQ